MKKQILEEYKKGNIVVAMIEGLQVMPLKEFIEQPIEGILYDLNRDEVTVLTFIDDPKWVNDYAVSKVIQALKKRIEKLEKHPVKQIKVAKHLDEMLKIDKELYEKMMDTDGFAYHFSQICRLAEYEDKKNNK